MSAVYPDTYQLKFCPFPPSFNTNSQYICFKYEKCCPQGCCYSFSYNYFHSWYFWLLVVLLFLIFYAASWYCKKMELKRKRRAQIQNISGAHSFASGQAVPSGGVDENGDHLLECLMQTYRARNISESRTAEHMFSGPPPKYQDALNMPTVDRSRVQVVQIHVNPNSSTGSRESVNDKLPTYDDATKGHKDGV